MDLESVFLYVVLGGLLGFLASYMHGYKDLFVHALVGALGAVIMGYFLAPHLYFLWEWFVAFLGGLIALCIMHFAGRYSYRPATAH